MQCLELWFQCFYKLARLSLASQLVLGYSQLENLTYRDSDIVKLIKLAHMYTYY